MLELLQRRSAAPLVVVARLQHRPADAPQLGEAAVVGDDAALAGLHHQDAVGGGLQRGAQQRDRAAVVQVGAAALDGAGQHLAHDGQQGQALLGPGGALAHLVEAQEPAHQPCGGHQGDADDRAAPPGPGRGRARPPPPAAARPGRPTWMLLKRRSWSNHQRNSSQEHVLHGRALWEADPLRAPLVRVARALSPSGREHEHVGPVRPREAADRASAPSMPASTSSTARLMNSAAEAGHQALELRPVAQGARHDLRRREGAAAGRRRPGQR